jgi:hypothetical protein
MEAPARLRSPVENSDPGEDMRAISKLSVAAQHLDATQAANPPNGPMVAAKSKYCFLNELRLLRVRSGLRRNDNPHVQAFVIVGPYATVKAA